MSLIERIAEEAGVSPVTVSRVLAGNHTYQYRPARERAERILAIAKRLDWRPNLAAKATRTGRFGTVALVLSTGRHSSNLPHSQLDGIFDILDAEDHHLTMLRLPDAEFADAGFVPRLVRCEGVDGFLINFAQEVGEDRLGQLRARGLPTVWMNSRHQADCVYPDDRGAGASLGRRLVALGHRQVAWVAFTGSSHYSVTDRRDGLVEVLRGAGATVAVHGTAVPEDGRLAAALAILDQTPRPTAVVGYSPMEMVAIEAAAAARGLQVPQDLSLLTIGDGGVGWPTLRALGGCVIPFQALGRAGATMLMQRIADPEAPCPPQVLPCPERAGSSCGPAPRRPRP